MKRVIIEFVGGYWDGKAIDSESSDVMDPRLGDTESEFANAILRITDNGTVGKGFLQFISPGVRSQLRTGELTFEDLKPSTGNHSYVITNRIEEDDGIWLQMKYSLRIGAKAREQSRKKRGQRGEGGENGDAREHDSV